MQLRPTIQPALFDFLAEEHRATLREVNSEKDLASLALALGAKAIKGWSSQEAAMVGNPTRFSASTVDMVRKVILSGLDPLGALYCSLRDAECRRSTGSTFTPAHIVDAMVKWAVHQPVPERIVDPGTGSGRYLLRAGSEIPTSTLVGIEADPLAAILTRANLNVYGFSKRALVLVQDFRRITLPAISGPTLFLGNPPYVRHHLINSQWKEWLTTEAAKLNLASSQLAGLHVHFFLATVLKAKVGDFGAFITASEWLDVNYGKLVRELFLGALGGKGIIVIDPTAQPFPDAATTAAVTYFEVGSKPRSIKVRRIEKLSALADLSGGRMIRRERFEAEKRWSPFTRVRSEMPEGYVELGELCRVHRGQVTGANKVWIAGEHSKGLPESVLFATVTKAREIIRTVGSLDDDSILRKVIDLPQELDQLTPTERAAVGRFLTLADKSGARVSYTAQNRKVWWSIGLREPAPILATYMARRPPVFVRNRVRARHINIAHGLYPREEFPEVLLKNLVKYLCTKVSTHHGRTYAGGLTKFEPREMERLPIPEPKLLVEDAC